ncbi:MAG: site-specific integrase [Lachnospiraceae bacterium]|nr:site-specific integrase [Lachnospiraceae bacterium]
MPKAKKTSAGTYRCQVVDHYEYYFDEAGKKHRRTRMKSFTAPTKREAEFIASQYTSLRDRTRLGELTVAEAIHAYITAKKNVLSPSTLRGYEILERNAFKTVSAIPTKRITQNDIQMWVNEYARTHSPKTCANAHGLLVSALAMYEPNLIIRTKLPQAIAPDLYTPTDDDIKKLIDYVKGTELEKAVLLAAFGTMRRGEIFGLQDTDISGNIITIRRTRVRGPEGIVVRETAKNDTSLRSIVYPDFVIDRLKGRKGWLVDMNPEEVSRHFSRLLKRCGLPHFRFHDLRAYSVSIAHAMGVPDAYIQEWGGWKNDRILKQVYRRTMADKKSEYSDMLNTHFSEIVSGNVSGKIDKSSK